MERLRRVYSGRNHSRSDRTRLLRGHQVAVSHGIETDGAAYSTVTSAFYGAAKILRSSNIAVRDESQGEQTKQVTYTDLAAFVQAFARRLERLNVKKDQRIPLVASQGLESIIAILGVLSCGAQFVLIDFDPKGLDAEYLRKVVAWSGQSLVLSTSSAVYAALKETLSERPPVRIVRIKSAEIQANSRTVRYVDKAAAHGVCYTVLRPTQGDPSAGHNEMRAVSVRNRSVTNLVCQGPGDLGIRPGCRVGQTFSMGSNLALWEIFGCLCNGGTLIIATGMVEKTLQEVDVLITTPTRLSTYKPDQFTNLQAVATIGEAISEYLADQWACRVGAFWHCYGSPETTIVSTMSRCHCSHGENSNSCRTGKYLLTCPTDTGHDGIASIGNPVPNSFAYILGDDGLPRLFNQPGWIWIGGFGVPADCVGYESNSYRRNPFKKDGSFIYRTGDCGFCDSHGSIKLVPKSIEQYADKGRDLYEEELQRITSSLAWVIGSSEVAVVAVGFAIHGFGFSEKSDMQPQVRMRMKTRMERQLDILIRCQKIPVGCYLCDIDCGIESLEEVPVRRGGKLDRKPLLYYLASKTCTCASAAFESLWPQTATVKPEEQKIASPRPRELRVLVRWK